MPYDTSRRKLEHATREAMIRDSHRGAQANWRAMMREQWGDRFEAPGEEMINVESPTTINHHHPPQGMGTLARLALAAAIASGFGLPIGAAMLGAPLLQKLVAPVQQTQPSAPAPFDPTLYDLRLGRP